MIRRWWPRWMREMDEEMDRLVRLPARWGPPWMGLRRASELAEWGPTLDMYDLEKEVVVEAELPGVDPQSIDLSVEGNALTIRASRKAEKEVAEEAYFLRERVWGTYLRTVQLPAAVDTEKIDATYKDGILRVSLPKKPEVLPKKIEIKVKG